MVVELTSLQTEFRMDESRLTRYAEEIMSRVSQCTPNLQWKELSLVLSDDRIRELNHTWFGKDTVTDVISFAYPEDGMGEVIVNVKQAFEEGSLRESPDHELALYIAHGCHHLTGAEDDTPEKKTAMLQTEAGWVEAAQAFAEGFFQ